mgnify:CR=1 FL=1
MFEQLKEWRELPKENQKVGYWISVPKSRRTILDSNDYEIVYVYFNGKLMVYRPGIQDPEPISNFRFLHMVNVNKNIFNFFSEKQNFYNFLHKFISCNFFFYL